MRASIFTVSLALSLIPSAALAESPLELTSDGCQEDDASIERTNQLVAEAGAAYDTRDLAQAIRLTEEAHRVSACVDLLFLLGQLKEEAKDECAARPFYERYLNERPSGPLADRARARVSALEGVCSETTPESGTAVVPVVERPPTSALPPPRSSASPKPEPYWTVPRTVAWSAIGASAVSSVVALTFALRAVDAQSEFEKLESDAWTSRHEAVWNKGHNAERRALWFGVAAGALAGTGALLLIFDKGGPSHTERAALSVGASPGGAAAEYRLRF